MQHLLQNEAFMLTGGDGVSDVNLPALLDYHPTSSKLATVTTVRTLSDQESPS